jgi:hypothetical protein
MLTVLLEGFLAIEDSHITDCQSNDLLILQSAGILSKPLQYLQSAFQQRFSIVLRFQVEPRSDFANVDEIFKFNATLLNLAAELQTFLKSLAKVPRNSRVLPGRAASSGRSLRVGHM